MAVENKYVDADVAAGKLGNPAFISGAEVQTMVFNFEVAAADDNNSVFRIARSLNPNLIVTDIIIFNDSITVGTDYNLGLYVPLTDGAGGAIIGTGNQFADALDMSAAAGIATPKNGFTAVAIEDIQQKLYEHAGQTVNTKESGYDIAFTAIAVGSSVGTISGRIQFIQG